MKFRKFAYSSRICCAALLSTSSLLFLSSCGEKESEAQPADQPVPAAEAPAAAEEAAPAPTPAPEAPLTPDENKMTDTRDALFNHVVYTLAQKVTSPDAFPELNSTVKDMLELMHAYYADLQKGEATAERARMALMIASTTRDLGAYAKAMGEYENALKEVQGLPAEILGSDEGQRMLSSCHNGMGVCLLAQNKASEALPKYEAATQVDEALYQAVAPKEGEALPEGDVEPPLSRAATDLLDSYRCLGDCQRAVDDPEEARATYMKGQAMAQRLMRLSSDMSLAYVKLLTSLGNLDNSMGKSKEAMGAWVMAAKICQSLNASSPKLDVKAETKRCFDALLPAIQSVGQKLQEDQAEAQKKAAEEQAAAEQAAAQQAAEEKAAAERLAAAQQQAPAEQPAAEQPAAPAKKTAARKKTTKKATADAVAQEETVQRVRKQRRRTTKTSAQ